MKSPRFASRRLLSTAVAPQRHSKAPSQLIEHPSATQMERAIIDIDEVDKRVQLATRSDQTHVQRSSTSDIVSIRSLGSGSYATVDLVSMPVGADRKLLVRKMLLTSDKPTVDLTSTALHVGHHQAPVPPLKPSSQQDWRREAAMHRECAHCPFVLQLLAAKRCRSGNLLLLLEYATQGSLTDILAARTTQLQQSAADRISAQPALAPGSGDASERLQAPAAVHIQQQASSLVTGPADNAASVTAEQGAELAAVLPLAVTAAHTVVGDELAVEEMPSDCSNAAHEHSLLSPLVGDDPVLVTLLEDASPAAANHLEDQYSGIGHCAVLTTASVAAGAAAVSNYHPVSHGLSEKSARFYAACLLMALHTLHSRRILHRDIKPCNLLLFHDGYLKLADLGCCCQVPENSSGACTRTGTAAYMAPEVLTGTEAYSYPVDMWSLGVVIWQMVAGSLPEWAQQQEQQQYPPVHYAPAKLDFPEHFTQELCDLLDGLLHPDSLVRLNIAAVKGSAWFEGFDWQALQDKTMEPPPLKLH